MRITVDVAIDQQPVASQCGYGNMRFQEHADLDNVSFESVAKIFGRIHDLLNVLKAEQEMQKADSRRR